MKNITSAETNTLTLVTAGASEYKIVRSENAGADENRFAGAPCRA